MIINVSGDGNNCGLFALVVGTKAALRNRATQNIKPQVLELLNKIDIDTLRNGESGNGESEIKEIGKILREQLVHTFQADQDFKKERLNNFVQYCVDSLLKSDLFNYDMEAFSKANANILQELTDEWPLIEGKINSRDKINFADTFQTKAIQADEINNLYKQISGVIVQINSENKFQTCRSILPTLLQESISQQDLIKHYILYIAAWERVTQEQASPEQRQIFNEYMLGNFENEILKQIINQKDVEKQNNLLELFALLKTTTFDENGNIKTKPEDRLVLEQVANLFTRKTLSNIQEQIYQNYCNYVLKKNLMLSADELGCLAKHWDIALTIQFGDKQPYKTDSGHLLQVTLCNPSRIHWNVELDESIADLIIKRPTQINNPTETRAENSIKSSSSMSTLNLVHSSLDDQESLYLAENYEIEGNYKDTFTGDLYQLKLNMLCAHRAYKSKKRFALGMEVKGFHKLDDLVIEYDDHFTALQAKHTRIANPIYGLADLKGNYKKEISLAKYFDSWLIIRDNLQNHFKVRPKRVNYVFFTNRELKNEKKDKQDKKHKKENTKKEILKPCFEDVKITDQELNLTSGKTQKFSQAFIDGINLTEELQDVRKELIEGIYTHSRFFSERIVPCLEVNNSKNKVDVQNSLKTLARKLANLYRKGQFEIEVKNSSWTKLRKYLLGVINKGDGKAKFIFTNEFIHAESLAEIHKYFHDEFLKQLKLEQDKPAEILAKFTFQFPSSEDPFAFSCKDYRLAAEKNEGSTSKPKKEPKILINSNKIQKFDTKDPLKADFWPEHIDFLSCLFGKYQFQLKDFPYPDNTFLHEVFQHQVIDKLVEFLSKDQNLKPKKESYEADIKSFFSDFIFKTEQPNEEVLTEIIQKELQITFNMAGKEPYTQFQDAMLNWMKDRKSPVYDQDLAEQLFDNISNELERLYLRGYAIHYEARLKQVDGMLGIYEKQVNEIINFLNNQSNSLLVVYSKPGVDKAFAVYMALKQTNRFQYDQKAIIDTDDIILNMANKALQSSSYQVLAINKADHLLEQHNSRLQVIYNTASQNNKKLILILDKNSLAKMANLSLNDNKDKIEPLEIPSLDGKQLSDILSKQGYAEHVIKLGEREVQLSEVLEDIKSGLAKVMQQPIYLAQILAASKPKKALEVPKANDFIDQQIQSLQPIYSLESCITALPSGRCLGLNLAEFPNPFTKTNSPFKINFANIIVILSELMKQLDDHAIDIDNDCHLVELLEQHCKERFDIEQKQALKANEATLIIDDIQPPGENHTAQWRNLPKPVQDKLMSYTGKKLIVCNYPDTVQIKQICDFSCIVHSVDTSTVSVYFDAPPIDFPLPAPIKFLENKAGNSFDRLTLLRKTVKPEITVIASDAGTGKSESLRQLRSDWQIKAARNSFQWVIHLNLNLITSSDIKLEPEKFIENYLMSKNGVITDWEITALRYDLKQKAVLFLLDAWDEVKEDKHDICLDFIKNYQNTVSMVITTRPYAFERLGLLIHRQLNLMPFEPKQVKTYLNNRFKSYAANLSTTVQDLEAKITQYVGSTYKYLSDDNNQKLLQVIGIPLQSYLFCEALCPHFKKWLLNDANKELLSDLWETEQPSKAGLYQQFIYTKLRIFFEQYLGVKKKSKAESLDTLYRYSRAHLQRLREISFEQLFQESAVCVTEDLNLENLDNELLELGLIRSIGSNKLLYEPLHPTFFEYFAAAYLLLGLKEVVQNSEYFDQAETIIAKHRFDKRYQIVWEFMHEMLNIDEPMLIGSSSLDQSVADIFLNPPDQIGILQQYLAVLAGREGLSSLPKSRPILSPSGFKDIVNQQGQIMTIGTGTTLSVKAVGEILDNISKLRQQDEQAYTDFDNQARFEMCRKISEELKKLAKQQLPVESFDAVTKELMILVQPDNKFSTTIGKIHYYVIDILFKLNNSSARELLSHYLRYHELDEQRAVNKYRAGSEWVISAIVKNFVKYPELQQIFQEQLQNISSSDIDSFIVDDSSVDEDPELIENSTSEEEFDFDNYSSSDEDSDANEDSTSEEESDFDNYSNSDGDSGSNENSSSGENMDLDEHASLDEGPAQDTNSSIALNQTKDGKSNTDRLLDDAIDAKEYFTKKLVNLAKHARVEEWLDFIGHAKVAKLVGAYSSEFNLEKEAKQALVHYLNYKRKGYTYLWNRVIESLLILRAEQNNPLVKALLELSQDKYKGFRTRFSRNADRWIANLNLQGEAIQLLINVLKDNRDHYEISTQKSIITALSQVPQIYKDKVIGVLDKLQENPELKLNIAATLAYFSSDEKVSLQIYVNNLTSAVEQSPEYIDNLRIDLIKRCTYEDRVKIVRVVAANLANKSHLQILKELVQNFSIDIEQIQQEILGSIAKYENRNLALDIMEWLLNHKPNLNVDKIFTNKPAISLNNEYTPAFLLMHFRLTNEDELPEHARLNSWWPIDAGIPLLAIQRNNLSPAAAAYIIWYIENRLSFNQIAPRICICLNYLLEQELTNEAARFYFLRVTLTYLAVCWKSLDEYSDKLMLLSNLSGFLHNLVNQAWRYYKDRSIHAWTGLDVIYSFGFIFGLAMVKSDNKFVIKMPEHIGKDIESPELSNEQLIQAEKWFEQLRDLSSVNELFSFDLQTELDLAKVCFKSNSSDPMDCQDDKMNKAIDSNLSASRNINLKRSRATSDEPDEYNKLIDEPPTKRMKITQLIQRYGLIKNHKAYEKLLPGNIRFFEQILSKKQKVKGQSMLIEHEKINVLKNT